MKNLQQQWDEVTQINLNIMYKIGQKVKVSSENDNASYDPFRDKVLIITHAETEGRGYDNSMHPEKLMCFETEEGEDVPFSLYEYEIEAV